MPDTILAGDFTVHYAADADAGSSQKRVEWTGAAADTRTMNELYSALQKLFDDPAQMDDLVPMKADTPDIYRIQNQWFIDDSSVEHLKTGALFSDKWVDGSTEHILVIGYAQTTEFDASDIGRTILGATTGDRGVILDFNATRQLLWIRPDDPLVAGDEFDNGTEAYTIPNSPFGSAQQDDGGVFTDETADANSATDNDWEIFPPTEATGDAVVLGYRQPFRKVVFDNLNGVQGVAGVVIWEYWDGAAWTALAGVTDGTTGFTIAVADGQELTFTIPTDWARRTLGGSSNLYFIRARVTTVYTTNPVYDQGFLGTTGVGSFASHTRHGAGSVPGESAWAGITTIGTIESFTHLYIAQEDPDLAAQSFTEILLTATKAATDWWSDGPLDILIKTKEADSVFGQLPNSSPATGVITVFARQYSKSYSHFIATALATAGGNTVVPLSTGDDLDNTTGHRQMALTDSAGNWNVDDRIRDDSDASIEGVILSVSGTNPTITLQYYLIGDPQNDFTGASGAFSNLDDTGTATAVAPTNVGPAGDTDITFAHGQFTRDINEDGTPNPYSIDLSNAAQKTMQKAYERTKFLTRRGETATASTDGQEGQFYVGSEVQIQYSSQAGGNWTEGSKVFDQTSGAEGVVVADHDDGAAGDVILRTVRGTFQTGVANLGDARSGPTVTADIDSIRTITPVSSAPFGTFPGASKFFMAAGLTPTAAEMAAGEAQKFSTIDDDGVTRAPPNKQTVEVTNLISGDTVAIFRRTGIAINKTQFTLTTDPDNAKGDSVIEVSSAIPSDNPNQAGTKIRVISVSGEEHRYRYASFSGTTFTLDAAKTGTADAGSNDTTLIDAAGAFLTAPAVEVGDYVRNTTDDVFRRVTVVVSATELTIEAGISFATGNSYSINTLVENYAQPNAYVPLIERIADAVSETTTITYSGDFDIRADVRRTAATAILPFTQDSSVVSTGRSLAAVRTDDTIIT